MYVSLSENVSESEYQCGSCASVDSVHMCAIPLSLSVLGT
jgi:hypothetical protein